MSQRHVASSPTLKGGLVESARVAFSFRNARARFGQPRTEVVPWLTLWFRNTYLWDEKREELLQLTVDAQTGSRCDPSHLGACWVEPGGGQGRRDLLERAYQLSRRHLQRAIAPRLNALQQEAERHLAVELARLERYYEQLLADLSRRNAPEKRQRTEQDRESRRHDLEQKFRLRVQAQLYAAELIDLRRFLVPVELKAGPAERRLELSYNCALHAFDPLACDHCLERTTQVWLCEHGHLSCPACSSDCVRCRSSRCACCEGDDLQSLCPDCLKVTAAQVPETAPAPAPVKKAPPPRPEPPRPVLKPLFAPFRHVGGLEERLVEPETLLSQNRLKECKAALEDLLACVPPSLEGLRQRLTEVLACFKKPWLERVRSELAGLKPAQAPKPTPVRAKAGSALPRVQEILRRTPGAHPEWVQQMLEISNRTASCFCEGVRPEVWAACLVYRSTRMTQAQAAGLYGVSTAQVSQHYRKVFDPARKPAG
ncbi:hypothetical protein DYH09_06005 [bacterium CPR1]|nr:hypothetical protein [bacterium CPR1]